MATIEISAIERTQKLKFSDGFWDLAKDMACKSDWHPAIFSVRLECFVSGGIFIVTAKVDLRPRIAETDPDHPGRVIRREC